MDVIITKNYNELSQKTAMIFLNYLALNPKAVFGLATGATPLGVYKELIKNSIKYSYNWSNVITFNLDEYYVKDLKKEDSYNYYMQINLFNKLNIKKNNIHIPAYYGSNVNDFCKKYEKLINDNPIDIQLLGIGENGHIGFNEPGSLSTSKTRLVNLSKNTLKINNRFFKDSRMPQQAITMGLSTILKAKKIVLIANGYKKAKAVKAMLEGKINSTCPASWLKLHPKVTIIIDEEAASLLHNRYNIKKTGWSDLRILNKNIVPQNKKILVISPHHDDSAVSVGAIMQSLVTKNDVFTLVMTSGYRAQIKGLSKDKKIKQRNNEAKKESKILGSQLILSQHKFYDNDKKFWRSDLVMFGKIFKRINPNIILLPHKYDEHPTHRLATELILDYLKEKNIRGIELWYYEGLWSQHILDKIDVVFGFDKNILKVKNRAMQAHKSQTKRLPMIEASEALAKFRAKTLPEQRFVTYGGNPPVIDDYVEAFHIDLI